MWTQLAGAALGGLLSSSGGKQKTKTEPWKEAQPWMKNLIEQGQSLQDQYMANPFSQRQLDAAGNQFGLLDYMMQMAPGLMNNYGILGQGYDRNAPNRTQSGYQAQSLQMPAFASLGSSTPAGASGLLGMSNVGATVPSNAGLNAGLAAVLSPQEQSQNDLDEWLRLIGSGA